VIVLENSKRKNISAILLFTDLICIFFNGII
jgi:hypothetical protein